MTEYGVQTKNRFAFLDDEDEPEHHNKEKSEKPLDITIQTNEPKRNDRDRLTRDRGEGGGYDGERRPNREGDDRGGPRKPPMNRGPYRERDGDQNSGFKGPKQEWKNEQKKNGQPFNLRKPGEGVDQKAYQKLQSIKRETREKDPETNDDEHYKEKRERPLNTANQFNDPKRNDRDRFTRDRGEGGGYDRERRPNREGDDRGGPRKPPMNRGPYRERDAYRERDGNQNSGFKGSRQDGGGKKREFNKRENLEKDQEKHEAPEKDQEKHETPEKDRENVDTNGFDLDPQNENNATEEKTDEKVEDQALAEPKVIVKTLEEWKNEQKKNDQLFNLRKPGEGADQKVYQKLQPIKRETREKDPETDDDEHHYKEKRERPLNIAIQFNVPKRNDRDRFTRDRGDGGGYDRERRPNREGDDRGGPRKPMNKGQYRERDGDQNSGFKGSKQGGGCKKREFNIESEQFPALGAS